MAARPKQTDTIRLAYLVSQYPALTHTFILREIRALRELGLELEVISIRPPDRPVAKLSPVEAEEFERTFTVLSAGLKNILAAHVSTLLRRPKSYLSGLLRALRLAQGAPRTTVSNLAYFAEAVVAGHRLLSLGIDHVHSHFSSTVALLIAYVFPVTFSATIHGSAEFNDVVGFYLAEKVAKAKFLCAISNYSLSQIMRASSPEHWSKLHVCPLGVDTKAFVRQDRAANRERLELLFVGSLVPPKGLPILLGAIRRLVLEGRDSFVLRLVGDGAGRGMLESAVKEQGLENHVVFEGGCTQDRVLAFYGQTDIFVMASFAEGLPVVLMEAMSMSIPCVSTWITGIPELIRDRIDGWLVPPADEGQLAAAIAHLIDDPHLRRRLGESARARVVENYDLTRNVARLAEVYRRCLGGRGPVN
jgi:glycosyltransferase involved in cell wall biosynthesis